jgi:4-hydroxybenzoate polyprenyltransferase
MNSYKSALALMRIPFSIYLMPVYWFALSALPSIDVVRAGIVFLILHLLVYPASNGYNSYYDRDEGSIGGLKTPPKVTPELMHLVLIFDLLAVGLGTLLSPLFGALIAIYLLVSKAYSYEGVRLKKFPIISTLVVTVFQGAFTFVMVQVGVGFSLPEVLELPNLWFALVSTLFLCGSYPLTQIYQHDEDKQRGDKTLSLILGIKGTYIFAAASLLLGTSLLLWLYLKNDQLFNILIFIICTSPVVYFFLSWFMRARRDSKSANYENTMLMNKVSSLSISSAFILMILFQ